MLDSTNLMIIASWDTAQMNAVEVEACLDGLTDSIRKVSNFADWDRGIADVFAN